MEPSRVTGPPPHSWLWRLWFLSVVGAVVLSVGARAEPHYPCDVAVAHVVQAHQGPVLEAALRAVNALGDAVTVVAVAVLSVLLLCWLRRWDLLLLTLAAVPLRGAVTAMQWLIDRPRPTSALVNVREHATGGSFPSGHVVTAVLVYGLWAVVIETLPVPRLLCRAVQAACLVVVVLMGPARVAVGAHWPSDTVGGYLWGGLVLVALIHTARGRGWLKRHTSVHPRSS